MKTYQSAIKAETKMMQRKRDAYFATHPMNKKGLLSIGDIPSAFIMLVIGVLVLAIGGKIVTQFQNQATVNQIDYNVTVKGGDALVQAGNFYPILGLVVIASVVIGVLFLLRT